MRKPFFILAALLVLGGAAACSRTDAITGTGRTTSTRSHDTTDADTTVTVTGDTTTRGGGGLIGSGG